MFYKNIFDIIERVRYNVKYKNLKNLEENL